MNTPQNTKQNLWRSLELLMQRHYGGVNLNRLSRESGVGLGTVARLRSDETSIGLDKLDKLAATFGVAPWDLLRPDFDPAATCIERLSPIAVELGRTLDSIDDPLLQNRAYVVALGALQLGSVQQGGEPTVVSPAAISMSEKGLD
ncbi:MULTISPECIES: helix-turn-helix domain-containing protein [Giesbergeria]|uniref:Helix-turn-helix domain-containing protein n=1 Tax=Giesbergeria sinuosa TaxID=80883 RepID=A0ABV9QG88_9BURK